MIQFEGWMIQFEGNIPISSPPTPAITERWIPPGGIAAYLERVQGPVGPRWQRPGQRWQSPLGTLQRSTWDRDGSALDARPERPVGYTREVAAPVLPAGTAKSLLTNPLVLIYNLAVRPVRSPRTPRTPPQYTGTELLNGIKGLGPNPRSTRSFKPYTYAPARARPYIYVFIHIYTHTPIYTLTPLTKGYW